MSTTSTLQATGSRPATELIISADSHLQEPRDLWAKAVPWASEVPEFPPPRAYASAGIGTVPKPGGEDPLERVKEMTVDGVSAEVIYPTLGLKLFGMDDAKQQEACFLAYNDYLIEYCKPNLDRLVGIACISIYDVDEAVRELERCAKAGLRGAMIWQVPHPDLPLNSAHYNPFWEAAQSLHVPISIHILTGHNYTKAGRTLAGVEHYRATSNIKTLEAANALFDFIWYGILDRYPGLRIVIVENEIGWIPFYLQQWDFYFKLQRAGAPPITREPSSYFKEQVYATFFNDTVGGHLLGVWGQDNCMWSSDYPHSNSTWPYSRDVIQRDLGHLPAHVRRKLVCDNVARLYGMKAPAPV